MEKLNVHMKFLIVRFHWYKIISQIAVKLSR